MSTMSKKKKIGSTRSFLAPFSKFSLEFWRILFLLGLIVSPFVVWPFSRVAYEIPRVIFWQVLSGILLCIATLRLFLVKKLWAVNWLLVVSYSLWLGSLIFSTWQNQAFGRAWLGNYYRADGFLTLAAFAALAVGVRLSWQQQWQKQLATMMLAVPTVVALWAISDAVRLWFGAGNLIPNWNGAIGVSFGQPNFLGGYFLISLPWVWFWFAIVKKWQHKVLSIFCGACLILGILTTQSLGTLAGVVLFGAFLVLIKLKKTRLIPLLVGLGITVFMGVVVWQGQQSFETEGRYRIFHKLLLAVQDKPTFGWGWNQVDAAFAAHVWPTAILHDVYVDKAHSHFLEMLVTGGVVGLVTYLGFLVLIGQKISSSVKKATGPNQVWWLTWLLLFSLYIFHTQTNVIGIAEEIPFWILVGMVI